MREIIGVPWQMRDKIWCLPRILLSPPACLDGLPQLGPFLLVLLLGCFHYLTVCNNGRAVWWQTPDFLRPPPIEFVSLMMTAASACCAKKRESSTIFRLQVVVHVMKIVHLLKKIIATGLRTHHNVPFFSKMQQGLSSLNLQPDLKPSLKGAGFKDVLT